MRAVLQRVSRASVTINGEETRNINKGLLVLLAVSPGDDSKDIDWLSRKITGMRIFTDDEGKMNLSVNDIGGDLMVVSQFTLYASTKKGNRPSFSISAPPETAIPLYEEFVRTVSSQIGRQAVTGEFGAHMDVSLNNDGPVTILLDTKNRE